MNSNQFLSLLKKGNDLQKEDFQQLVKLHDSFPYFQIPAVLAAKYELQKSKKESSELLHIAAILSPDRSRLKYIVKEEIGFIDTEDKAGLILKTIAPTQEIHAEDIDKDNIQVDSEIPESPSQENESPKLQREEDAIPNPINAAPDLSHPDTDMADKKVEGVDEDNIAKEKNLSTSKDLADSQTLAEDNTIKANNPNPDRSAEDHKEEEESKMINTSQSDRDSSRPDLIPTPYGGDEATRPDLILPDAASDENAPIQHESQPEIPKSEEEEQSYIKPIKGPPSSRQDILKQLEDNLARLKSESDKNKQPDTPTEAPKPGIIRRKRPGEDLIDSIKKKEKREIKDTKKKEQNDIIKAFNKKSIKLAAIKENEDVNKLQDLSLPSTKINDRMVSESYAKLLTQQGKKAAAKEIYKKLILKFPQKKAYFADLIQQLEE